MKNLGLAFLLVVLFMGMFVAKVSYAEDFSKDSIYFILVDRFDDGDPSNNPPEKIYSKDKSQWKFYWGGDLQGIIDRLPYIKKMGYTAIWITPVVENIDEIIYYGENKEEKVTSYHGYWARDFKRMNPYFGDKAKFKELVDKAHQHDIKIILDFVLNHTSPVGQGEDGVLYDDGKLVATYSNDPDGWFHHNGSIDWSKPVTVQQWQNQNLFDLADLAQENPKVRQYLLDSALMWTDMGIDAFRIDTVRHLPTWFAKEFVDTVQKRKPGMFVFGEWSMGGLAIPETVKFTKETGMHIIDFQLTFFLTDAICKGESFNKVSEYIKNDDKIENPHLMVTCIDNHDMPRFISTLIDNGFNMDEAQERTAMATYILQTSRGIPCIYYGTEQFLHVDQRSTWGYGGEPYNRQMMTGFDNENDFMKNIKKLNDLRQENLSISKGTQKTLLVNQDVWVYEREYGGNVVLVAVNKGDKTRVNLKGTRLPSGIYSNQKNFRVVMGLPINVLNGETSFDLNRNQTAIWEYRK